MNKFEALTQVIKERRSVFPPMFSDVPVSDDQVMELLENANWAPNHRKTEPWRFQVFTGEALTRLGQYMADFYRTHTPAEKFVQKKYDKMLKNPTLASHVIAICMKKAPDGIVPEWEELAAVSAAVQNLWLSCSAMGLGGYWSTPRAAVEGRKFFKLEENEQCYGLFYLGKPKPELELQGMRGDIKEKVVWHR